MKPTTKKIILAAAMATILATGFFVFKGSDNNVSVVSKSEQVPVRLKIEKLNLDAEIIQVGVTPEGNMDAPEGPKETGWYNLGPKPGEVGNAVIAGHYGWKDGIQAAFDELSKLKKGDRISVTAKDGWVSIFEVRESRTYKADENPADVFLSNDGKAHLNLVTCSGSWNANEESYTTRLVVFTDKVEGN
jgi:LPXTG-site transpeptidase (sortase) family protein